MRKIISKIGYTGGPVIISGAGLLTIALIAPRFQDGTLPLWKISHHSLVNLTFTMQMMMLSVSFLALVLMYIFYQKGFKSFFRLGISRADKKNNWNFYGPAMAVFFTLGTLLLMSASVSAQNGVINKSFFRLLPLVLLFSATNAWSEEIISRFVIVAGLDGKLKPVAICWISAIIFGAAHFSGTPSGVSGVIMSGTLGWFLAKSVIETRGLGWAWFIHFLQDFVIFGAGAMIIAGQR